MPENPDNLLFCSACGSKLLLKERYRVIRLLGSGGFGNTYEVSHSGTLKVLKILQLDRIPLPSRTKVLSLFQQEARVLMQLQHPGIPKGTRYFEFFPRNSQEPLHCLVMQKIEGMDLQEYLSQLGRPIDQELAIEWMMQLILILAQVHGENFFHRDIKPSNIMFQPNGELVLIDFGTAREVTGTVISGGGVTQVATPGYTPPEQLYGQAEPRSDFFALGRTFVFLLTGKEPNDPELYDADNDEFRWRDYAGDLSPAVGDFIDRLMARVPRQRPANAGDILKQLLEISRAMGLSLEHVYPGRSSLPPTVPMQSVGSGVSVSEPPTVTNPGVLSSSSLISPWQNVQLERTLTGHSDFVFALAIGPDGETIASGGRDKYIKLWSASSGEELRAIEGHAKPISALAISPDGQILVSASDDKQIKLWDLNGGEEINRLRGHAKAVNCLAISPDGEMLASGGDDKNIKLWDLATGEKLGTLTGHSGLFAGVYAVAISPDGKTLVSASDDKTIKLWDLESRREIYTFLGHSDKVRCLAIAPDGQTIVSGSYDKTIKLWNINTGQEIRTLVGHEDVVYAVAIGPDGQTIASSSNDKSIKLWTLGTSMEPICTLRGHSDPVGIVAFSPDGETLVSGSDDKTVKIWRRR